MAGRSRKISTIDSNLLHILPGQCGVMERTVTLSLGSPHATLGPLLTSVRPWAGSLTSGLRFTQL